MHTEGLLQPSHQALKSASLEDNQTHYSAKAQDQRLLKNLPDNPNASALSKTIRRAEPGVRTIRTRSQRKLYRVQNQTIPTNTKCVSAPLSPYLETIENTRTCGAITKFENSNTPKHKKYGKTSMDTRLKKRQSQYGTDRTVIKTFLKEKPFGTHDS